MKIFLHHAPLELKGDIPKKNYGSFKELCDNLILDSRVPVWLLTYEWKEFGEPEDTPDNEIFIAGRDSFVFFYIDLIEKWFSRGRDNYYGVSVKEVSIYLQEYTNYEEAYQVALTMKEGMSYVAYKLPTIP